MTSTSWKRLRGFNYTDLRFLYLVCLLTIALVYTAFRGVQFYLNAQGNWMPEAMTAIANQREVVAELNHLLLQGAGVPRLPELDRRLNQAYQQMANGQKGLFKLNGDLKENCRGRPCAVLFDPNYLNAPGVEQDNSRLAELAVHYHFALADAQNIALKIAVDKNHADRVLDFVGYFAVMALLAIQALFIFRPAIRRLDASLSTRSDFLSLISHEIRNPMNSVLGMADILKGTRLTFEQQQYVENLTRSGNALLDMLNNLIDFSVIESGRFNIKAGTFDLFHSVNRCLSLIAVQAHHKNLNLYVQIDREVPSHLHGDSLRLDQVLINLLNNAVKFTEQGYICLSIQLSQITEKEVGLTFAVTDSGIGISPELHKEIFESFVQGDSSIQRKYGGSGLGLSISREILRLMDATLHVESTVGHGAKFFFTLNLPKKDGSEKSAPLERLQQVHLVFLTAQVEAEIYRRTFATLNCPAHVLSSAVEFRDRLNNPLTPAVDELLIDDSIGIISMINCRNLAEEFALNEKCVALIRSNFSKENMDLLRRNGFRRFLTKPLKPWDLLQLPPLVAEEISPIPLNAANPGVVDKLKEKNLRVLLVDDSNDNLFLLKEVINPLASTIHFAGNGLEAIEKFRHHTYDVVFMDIQMPVMDGYTAIRKMRENEVGSGQTIPIYAVTAHAGLVDAQKCREAGFTDRIVKPVGKGDIYKSLSKAFSLDMAEMDRDQENVLPAKYLAKLMPTYFKTRFEDVEKLKLALAKIDFAGIKNLGHKIKGSAASYGFPKAAELSQRLEHSALAQDLEGCRKIADQLERMFREEHERFKA